MCRALKTRFRIVPPWGNNHVQSLPLSDSERVSRSDGRRGQSRGRRPDGRHRQGAEKERQVHAAQFRNVYGEEDEGAEGAQSADRRVDQSEGWQDGSFQGLADTEKGGLTGSDLNVLTGIT